MDNNNNNNNAMIADQLTDIKDEIREHMDNASQMVRSVGGVFEQRATGYWISHIRGALDKESDGSQSMFTMQDSIDELWMRAEDAEDPDGDVEDVEDPEEVKHVDGVLKRVWPESRTKRLVANLIEGEGTPGFDVPHEEATELKIANEIIQVLDNLYTLSDRYQGNVVRLNHPKVQLHLDEIRKLTEELISLHSPESTVPAQ